ncbi:MAG TPA: NAD(P)H-binding protein [Pseudosphingobacterium sp.]|nr:NAD(P)H-binding protein [Pseudosphingobacterium sp.]
MKIVITGSLGNIGKPLAESLVSKGHSVTIISSNLQKQQDIEHLGATAVIGSISDIGFLTQAFGGADSVFCMTPPNYSHPDQLGYYKDVASAYQKAITNSEVNRAVYLSSYGAHLPSGTGFIKGSYFSEQILNTTPDLTLTHLRPTFFYYNLLGFINMIKSAGFMGSVYGGDDRLTMVSPTDIAEAASDELVKTDSIEKVRYVASDDRSCKEIAAVLGNAIGIPSLKWLVLPKDQVIAAMKKNGMNDEAAENYVELGESIHTGKLREDFDLKGRINGKMQLEEYAKEFAAAFNRK